MSPEGVSDNRHLERSLVEVPKTYSITDQFPKYPDVTVLFEGLMWFIFHGSDECQVGIHNSTYGIPHRHPHELGINVWTIKDQDFSKCTGPQRVPIGNPKTITAIQIDVNRPKDKDVRVFQQEPFGRHNPLSHAKDWRWVIDFDRYPLYPEGVQLVTQKINPGITINHGLFYTLHKTTSEFSFVSEGQTYALGNVPQYLGCDIGLDTGGDVTLTVRRAFPHSSQSIELKKMAGISYQIDITNVCAQNGKRCDNFNPAHPSSPQEWNDFYLYYDTCIKPSNAREYGLKRTRTGAPPGKLEFCYDRGHKEHIDSNNEAPCGPVTAGGGGGGG